MNRSRIRSLVGIVAGTIALMAPASGRAAIPSDYRGTPFDPAVGGGAGKIPPTVKAGPYSLPGRIDFINYDMGGDGVGYHTTDHVTNNGSASIMLALGYRTDKPTATLCLTNQVEKDNWYNTGTSLDGTLFPSPTTADYYIGAVRPNDWFNFTVDVQTAGTYAMSSTWASGSGCTGLPQCEGGDGTMELQVFVNEAKTPAADWKAVFPNYKSAATFHNWVSYPSFATVTLDRGLQLIKLQSIDAHLNLAYVQFSLVLLDGGLDDGNTSTEGGAGDGGPTGASGSPASSGGTNVSGPSSSGTTGTSSSGGDAATSGSTPAAGAGGAGGPDGAGGKSGSGCTVAGTGQSAEVAFGLALAFAPLVIRARRRRR